MESPRQDRYDLFTNGSFWDLAVIFGFSNVVDGDSFTSTPQGNDIKLARPFSRATSSPLGASWTTLPLDDEELSFSRNQETASPTSSQKSDSGDEESMGSDGESMATNCPSVGAGLSRSSRKSMAQCSTPCHSPFSGQTPYRIIGHTTVRKAQQTPMTPAVRYVIKFCSPTPQRKFQKLSKRSLQLQGR